MPTTQSDHGLPVCENLLNRDFGATEAGRKWVSDLTYLDTREGWVYLTVVLDLFDREVVGWAFRDDMRTEHTTVPAHTMAGMNRRPGGGAALSLRPGGAVLRGIVQGPSAGVVSCGQTEHEMRRGIAQAFACAESFFKTLKTELEPLDGNHSATEIGYSVFELQPETAAFGA
jgi:transposase InsO family protein